MSDSNSTTLHQEILQAGITVNDEKLLIATNLHVSIFLALLMGIYTVIFGGTMYAYLIQKRSKHYAVAITISVLYISNIAAFSLEWYSTKLQFIDNGASRDTIFVAIYTNGPDVAVSIALEILTAVSLVLGDGLLIWRCFNLWNRSVYAISITVFLTFVEAGLMLTQAIGTAIAPTAAPLQIKLAKVIAAGIFVSGCNTAIATVQIAYRIHLFLKHQGMSSRKFRHVTNLVLQSGIVYSLSLLIYSVLTILMTQSTTPSAQIFSLAIWANIFVFPLAGMTTTIMVARVATLSDENNAPTSGHLTGIQFRPRSTARTGTDAQVSVVLQGPGDTTENLAIEDNQAQASNSVEKIKQEV
ncbi:hypothetical protein BDN70DRAFT_957832 [Pholiota conissans]|uniref:Uncharacterized protein n=1 Tax=Pholiota conissans TaxID=109636 RepID=A0A9P5YTH9_9AGAR|nr:hypothetical protein BDN70DRAFT_957832 [Pholiota conissans]